MIDIHCHVLPGIDDGPKNWEQSMALCEALVADGITTAVATPHLIDGIYPNSLDRVEPLTAQLNQRLSDAGIALKVLPGAEVDIASRYITGSSEGLPTLGGHAVLLEMPVAVIPGAMAEIIFTILSRGLIPILAHPERNELVQDSPSHVQEWVDAGAMIQLDGDSLLGQWGKASDRSARSLLTRGLCHALASDAHSCDRRPPRLRRAVEKAAELIGEEAARSLVTSGPEMILAGTAPPTPMYDVKPDSSHGSTRDTPRRRRRKGFVSRLLGRAAQ